MALTPPRSARLTWQRRGWVVAGVLLITGPIVLGLVLSRHETWSAYTLFNSRTLTDAITGGLQGAGVFLGAYCLRRARRIAVANEGRPAQSVTRSVVYLRPFREDRRAGAVVGLPWSPTIEEEFGEVFATVGHFTALGDPQDPVPHLGAERRVVDSKDWQQIVLSLIHDCELVVFRAVDSDSVRWEFGNVVKHVDPARVVLLVRDRASYTAFSESVSSMLPAPLPPLPRRVAWRLRRVLPAIVSFSEGWEPRLQVCRPPWLSLHPVGMALQRALADSGLPWQRPTRSKGDLIFAGFAVCALLAFAGLAAFLASEFREELGLVRNGRQRAMLLAQAEVINDPRVAPLLKGLNRQAKSDAVDGMRAQGWAAISDVMTLKRGQLRSQMFDRADIATCAAMARGQRTEGILAVIEAMTDDEFSTLLALNREAAIAAMEKRPAVPVDTAAVAQARSMIFDRLDGRFRAAEFQLAQAPDSDACTFERAVMKELLRLPSRYQIAVMRQMALQSQPAPGHIPGG